MRTIVLDASVIIKWIFPEPSQENHIPQALNILEAIKKELVRVKQPPHWLAEVAAVVVRLQPKIVEEVIGLLYAMEFPIIDTLEVYRLASQLAHRYDHHVFDSMYHAVAICNKNAQLITADQKYYKKVHKEGSIILLSEFSFF